MRNRERRRRHFHEFILMILLKEGALGLQELEEKMLLLVRQFHLFGYHFAEEVKKKVFGFLSWFWYQPPEDYLEIPKWQQEFEEQFDARLECNDLIEKDMLRVGEGEKYELTEKGREEAQECARRIEKGAEFIGKRLLSPQAAARNTIIVDFFLAVMKLLAGFFSGSVGLLADGADAAIDTVSASIVWIGVKYKKELLGTLVIIVMMFVTAASVGYESTTKIIQAITRTITPISMPFLVIVVEGVALLFALILSFYQRYVGKRNGSLALISQSMDSKNHIYVAAAVIIGAIFSIFGIHFVDALIGAFIAVRIFMDGVGLSKEVISSIKGEETDFSKYEIPFEKHWHLSKLETFRTWILYSIREDNLKMKYELISSLEKTFQPEYIPILSEFKFMLGEGFDFEKEFDNLVEPLLDKKLLVKKDDKLILTKEGEKHVDKVFGSMRYHHHT